MDSSSSIFSEDLWTEPWMHSCLPWPWIPQPMDLLRHMDVGCQSPPSPFVPFDEKRMIEWSRVGHRLAFLRAVVPA